MNKKGMKRFIVWYKKGTYEKCKGEMIAKTTKELALKLFRESGITQDQAGYQRFCKLYHVYYLGTI